MGWFVLAIGAMLFFGICNILFKVGAELRLNPWTINVFFYSVAAILSLIFYFWKKSSFSNISGLEVIIGGGIGVASLVGVAFLQYAFRKSLGALVFPVISLNGIMVVLFSLLVYKEEVSLVQGLGIILAFVSIIMMKMG